MFIEIVHEFNEEIFQAVCRLVPLLGDHKIIPTREELAALINSKETTLLMARYPEDDSNIAGMLTVSIYRVPTGIRSIVEDVIVDVSARRHGIAKALMNKAIELARKEGANGVALTSNTQRVEANLLYQNIGFIKRQTNSYFYKLK